MLLLGKMQTTRVRLHASSELSSPGLMQEEEGLGARKMAQQVKELAADTDGQSSIPRTHMWKKKTQSCTLTSTYGPCPSYAYTP